MSACRRVGVSACRRVGVSACGTWGRVPEGRRDRRLYERMEMSTARGPFLRLDCPAVGLINHFNDLIQNFVASVIQFLEDPLAKIVMSKSNLDMDLGLGVQPRS